MPPLKDIFLFPTEKDVEALAVKEELKKNILAKKEEIRKDEPVILVAKTDPDGTMDCAAKPLASFLHHGNPHLDGNKAHHRGCGGMRAPDPKE